MLYCLWSVASQGAGEGESTDRDHLDPELVGSLKSGLAIHPYILRIFLNVHVEVAPCSSEDVDERLANIDWTILETP